MLRRTFHFAAGFESQIRERVEIDTLKSRPALVPRSLPH